jgi:hypothetical protein
MRGIAFDRNTNSIHLVSLFLPEGNTIRMTLEILKRWKGTNKPQQISADSVGLLLAFCCQHCSSIT